MEDGILSRRFDHSPGARLSCLFAFGLLALAAPPRAGAAPQLSIAPLGYRIEQIAAVAGAPRSYELTARAGLTNTGDVARAATARLSGSATGVLILDGQLSFGDVGRATPLKPALSHDTFKLRVTLPASGAPGVLLRFLQSTLEALTWSVSCANCGDNRPPVAHAGADQTGDIGQTLILDGAGSADPEGAALGFRWSLISAPTGSTATLSDPAAIRSGFTPDRDGHYVFQLIVNDGALDSAPAITTVTTRNSAPVARAGPDRKVVVGVRVELDGSASTDVDGDRLTYEWSLLSRPEASMAELLDADPASPFAAFRVDQPGEYLAELVVFDGAQESAPDTVAVSTINSAPVADAGPDRAARVGERVELSGLASQDADGDALTFHWSLTAPPGSRAALETQAGGITAFVVDRPGAYLVQLIVHDGTTESAPDTALFSTVNSPPVADAGPDRTIDPGEAVMFDGSASYDPDGDPLGFTWSLIAVPPGSRAALSDPHAIRPVLEPDTPGPYVAQLIVHDGQVNSAPAAVTIRVRDLPPAVGPAPVVERITLTRDTGDQVRVSGAAGSVEGGAQVIVANFNTGESTFATAAADGSFVAFLSATDDEALIVTARDTAGRLGPTVSAGALAGIELTIDIPSPHQTLVGPSVLVSGRLRAPPNTGVTVNDRPAAVFFDLDGSSYEVQIELALSDAPVPIEVRAHTADGRSLTRTVPVQVVAIDGYALGATPAEGPAPLEVSFEIGDRAGAGIVQVAMDFDGDGHVDGVSHDPAAPLRWTYAEPGTYRAEARIIDAYGDAHTAAAPVYVREAEAVAASPRAVWEDFTAILARGGVTAARARLNGSAERLYGPALELLAEQLPQVLAGFSAPHLTEIRSEVAELVVAREIDGVPRAFFIYLTRGQDGVWRIAGM